jgi:hypothetical protein
MSCRVHGSGVLTRWLFENDLVDEINLLTVPVVVGQGARLFPDTVLDIALVTSAARLRSSRSGLPYIRASWRRTGSAPDDWRGVFEPLRDQDYFALAAVDAEAGTITWPNGSDMAPEPLYEQARLNLPRTASARH